MNKTLKGKINTLIFEGVYKQARIFLNGKKVRTHKYGYTSFDVDIFAFVDFDIQNVIAVRVLNASNNSRWYSDLEIYRHIYMSFKDSVHFKEDGISITTPIVDVKNLN